MSKPKSASALSKYVPFSLVIGTLIVLATLIFPLVQPSFGKSNLFAVLFFGSMIILPAAIIVSIWHTASHYRKALKELDREV